jgi:hypothetical protein
MDAYSLHELLRQQNERISALEQGLKKEREGSDMLAGCKERLWEVFYDTGLL